MVTKTLMIPIYERRLHVVITGDFIKDYPALNKKYHQTFTEEDDVMGMACHRRGHLLVLINVGKLRRCFKGHINVEANIANTIAHEAVHLCNQLFEAIGAVTDQNNDESQAYLTGWFVQQITTQYLIFKQQEDVKKI